MYRHYEEQAEQLGREVGHRADELRDAASQRASELAQQAQRVKAQARELMDRGAQRARDGVARVHDDALAAGRRAEQYVRDEPLRTVVAAAATGAAIGGLLVWLLREPRRY